MKRIIVLSLLTILSLSIYARVYSKGENVYVNVQQDFNWSDASAKLYLYFFQSWDADTKWMELTHLSGNLYMATWTADAVYDRVVVVRKDPSTPGANWDGNIWNQTCNLAIPEYRGCNVLTEFYKKGDSCEDPAYSGWQTYTPAAATIPAVSTIKSSGVTEEIIHVCPNAAGDPFSLKVKLNSAKTEYVYDDVMGHGWFKSINGTSWTSIDSYAGNTRAKELEQDIVQNTLPSPLPATLYYYLYSNIASGRRLIKIVADANCELDCSITSFETAISAVNADDNTYTLDGMVAFGKANGDLVIECDGKSTTITSPKSPQSFSLAKVPAATADGTTTTATAHFTGDNSCTKTITIHVPNAKEAVDEVKVDSLTGREIILVPQDADPNNDYVWIINGQEYTKADGQSQNCTIPAINVDSTATYIYKEFYPAPGTMDDMMSNGSYEVDGFNYGKYGKVSSISDYNYWGIHQQSNADQEINFYDTCSLRTNPEDPLDNGFAVVRNANKFHPTFAKVKAREGNNFALFDAASGEAGGNKRAWYATTANNPNLKLKKGTTYVLSFWAANITNYGEMDNAARFKFRIEYNGKKSESKVLDLGTAEFRNNIWHQHSETFYAEEDCNNVTISVVNLNTKNLNVGNDFALDDIQFHAISSVSKVVKSQQQFTLTTHEPRVDAFTVTTQNMLCSADQFTLNMSVTYRNAQGKLCIRDIDRDSIYLFTVPEKAIEEQGTYSFSIVLPDSLAAVRNWEAYFQIAPVNKQTVQSVAPERYSCIKTDTTLCEGQTLTWKGTDYPQTPYLGTDTFTVGYDSLILTIKATPRVTVGTIAMTCDQANEIRIPFAPANGSPDSINVEVSGVPYPGTIDSTDTQNRFISFSLPTMTAGDYAAVLHIGGKGITCETTENITFTIALSGQMYSKWTDVLFISNKDGRFTGYQWFADGVLMSGETMQRLYDANGLSGTSILYHCRLTTTDGKTLYTCPQTFDEITPSRTVTSTPNAVQSTKIYDAMGRVINGTPHNGIYIVFEVMEDGTTRTRKINAYE